jgi:HAD superfamily hydrolase (TIGR01509 family)
VRFRAILFDAGETLVHPTPSFPERFSEVLATEGHPCAPEEVVEASKAVFHRFSEAARNGELWTTSPQRSARFWNDVYDRMLASLGLPGQDGIRDRLYATFTDLASYGLFERLGVRDRFPVRVISGVVGVEKPDERIYRLALERAEARAEEAVYVGDNPEFDVWPAAALGMTPVLIDRRGRFPDHEGLRITDLRHLPAVLEDAS